MLVLEEKVYWTDEGDKVFYKVISGASDETMPTDNIAQGSVFNCTDTGDVYLYDAESSSWIQQGGGGLEE